MNLTLTGTDTCTDVGRIRTLEITEHMVAITDYLNSTVRDHRFTVQRAPTDSEYHRPILRYGLDEIGQPYTLVEFYSEIPLPCVTCRIQAWHSDPYNLFVCMIVLEKDPYTGSPYQLRGPFFRLEEPSQDPWNTFLVSLATRGKCVNCNEQPALMIKTVAANFQAYGGFQYPREVGAVVKPKH